MRTAIEDWNQRAICEFLRLKNISWKFNPPYIMPRTCRMGTDHQIHSQGSNSLPRATVGE